MSNERVFQFTLGVFVLQVEKFEHQWIANLLVSGDSVTRLGLLNFQQHRGFIFRQRCAFVKLRVNLPVKLPNHPAGRQRLARIELAPQRIPHP